MFAIGPITLLHKEIHVDVAIVESTGLGDRSYLVSADGIAVVIDPQRDIDRVLDLIRERGLRIPCTGDPHPQRLPHRRAGAVPYD